MINVPGESPKTYSKVYETHESHELYAGVSDIDMAEGLMKQLSEEGFEMVNLCGAFDDETVQRFIKIGQGKIAVSAARYSPDELLKLEKLTSLKEYGFISLISSIDQIDRLELFGEKCNTHVFFVRDLEMACQAATELVGLGVDFIELCNWFDLHKTQSIIDAIHGKVPVGSCAQDPTGF
jgi:hypothetical protein